MAGHKKYPHVALVGFRLRLDRVLKTLECHLRMVEGGSCMCVGKDLVGEDIEELRKVIEYRGNVLWVRKGRKGCIGEHMTIKRENGS